MKWGKEESIVYKRNTTAAGPNCRLEGKSGVKLRCRNPLAGQWREDHAQCGLELST